MSSRNDAVITFRDVSYEYSHVKPILKEANFAVRRGAKMTLMGQNGAGKSTLFGLITRALRPESGQVNVMHGQSIALARQVIPRDELELTVREFFAKCFKEKVYDIDPRIEEVLEIVNLKAPGDRIVRSFSGGQQARLLLASALIQKPDILLLDEPTNNLDVGGIRHLTDFLKAYSKTCLVISHDAEFLNAFTHGVLYLDVRTHTIEQYDGNYNDVLEDIKRRVESEQRKNAQLEKEIKANKEKANFFANKGGNMRLVAKRMREKAEDAEENMVDVRKEDKTIRPFTIPHQHVTGDIIRITSYKIIKDHKAVEKKVDIALRRNERLQLKGPNGIGKSTLLESLASGHAKGEAVADGVRIGYYRQDFSTLDFESTVYDTLISVMEKKVEQDMRSCAAGFLIGSDMMNTRIGSLSEGQKGLVAFARLVLMRPGLLILDEPTNHINFRHIPVIAEALNTYEGAMILVSHVPDFVEKMRIDKILDLGKS
jgi:ATPase subunit of ABC transporter with duplicated ATPase domains